MNTVPMVFQENVVEHVFACGVHASVIHVYMVGNMIVLMTTVTIAIGN